MIVSSYFHCSHSLKQKAGSLFTPSDFLMSTDVSYNSVVKDTAPRLHVWHWLLSAARLLPPGTGWLC